MVSISVSCPYHTPSEHPNTLITNTRLLYSPLNNGLTKSPQFIYGATIRREYLETHMIPEIESVGLWFEKYSFRQPPTLSRSSISILPNMEC